MFQVDDAGSTGMIGDLVRKLNQNHLSDWANTTVVYTIIR